jgi:hypothetical protein
MTRNKGVNAENLEIPKGSALIFIDVRNPVQYIDCTACAFTLAWM